MYCTEYVIKYVQYMCHVCIGLYCIVHTSAYKPKNFFLQAEPQTADIILLCPWLITKVKIRSKRKCRVSRWEI